MKKLLLNLIISLPLALSAAEDAKEEVAKISESFGHLIGKNIDALGVDFDIAAVIKGLQDSISGKDAPMSEADCIEALTAAQEAAHKKQAEENLASAEAFLKENGKKKGIVTAAEGKVQYKIEKKGKGAKVEKDATPLIQYVGKFLDGSVFGSSEKAEAMCLADMIKGFQEGLVGMKEGEKRTLYIHPEYGYGTSGYLPPNSLLTFEIEVVKADASQEDEH